MHFKTYETQVMKMKLVICSLAFCSLFFNGYAQVSTHDIIFCGEKIPVSQDFISKKLMNVIRRQIPYVNLPELRRNANKYFSIVEAYLKATGLPEDFKYLAIVESGFKTAVSPKGATGFWQIMLPTAKEYGLTVNEFVDERNDIYKSTYAACRQLANYYNGIAKEFKIYSWVLTAAAYNFGIGNMGKAIRKQGKDYFQMNLNEETANYVYKIIAVKELWEYPELYMKDFGYNVFNAQAAGLIQNIANYNNTDAADFSTMVINVDAKSSNYPTQIKTKELSKNESNVKSSLLPVEQTKTVKFVTAIITGKYKKFKEGDIVSFTLVSDLQVGNRYTGKKNIIQGVGWVIDNRVFVDLGYEHNVIVYDQTDSQKGLTLASLKSKTPVLLKVHNREG